MSSTECNKLNKTRDPEKMERKAVERRLRAGKRREGGTREKGKKERIKEKGGQRMSIF